MAFSKFVFEEDSAESNMYFSLYARFLSRMCFFYFTLFKSKRKNGKRKANKVNERNNAKRLYKYTDRERTDLVLFENIFSSCLATTVVFVGFTISNGRIFA